MTLETDKDISKLRQDKNITLEELSEAMRLPVSRIEFLEKGHFENEDKVILKLQLKNYAKFTGINYQTVLKLSGLDKKPENVEAKSYTVAVKKTHSYSGRKKQINPAVIYSFVVIAAIVLIVYLNQTTSINQSVNTFQTVTDSVSENENISAQDTGALFKPYIPQSQKNRKEQADILADMAVYKSYTLRTPVTVNVFPRQDIIYHLDYNSSTPEENFIMKNRPKGFSLDKNERLILFNARNCRLIIDSIELFTENYSRIAIKTAKNNIVSIYVK